MWCDNSRAVPDDCAGHRTASRRTPAPTGRGFLCKPPVAVATIGELERITIQPDRDALELVARNRPRSIVGLEGKVDWMVSTPTPADQETEVVPPAEEPEEMPLPSDPKVTFLGGLFVLALLATAYVASEIVLPLVFAIILKLLLQPGMRLLERLRVPRMLAALLLILALFGTIVGVGAAVSGPAGTWAAKLPEGIPRLQERLSFMREPIDTLQRFLQQVEDFGGAGPSPGAAASARGPTLLTKLFTGTRNFASGLFTTVLFLFSCSCPATSSCTASSRSCRASAASARSSKSRSNRKRHLRVSGHDHDHERGGRYRHGIGDVAHGSGRPDPLGDGGLSVELRADPRHGFGRVRSFCSPAC